MMFLWGSCFSYHKKQLSTRYIAVLWAQRTPPLHLTQIEHFFKVSTPHFTSLRPFLPALLTPLKLWLIYQAPFVWFNKTTNNERRHGARGVAVTCEQPLKPHITTIIPGQGFLWWRVISFWQWASSFWTIIFIYAQRTACSRNAQG